MREIKTLAEFDLNVEKQFIEMSVDDFYFHIMVKKSHQDG